MKYINYNRISKLSTFKLFFFFSFFIDYPTLYYSDQENMFHVKMFWFFF